MLTNFHRGIVVGDQPDLLLRRLCFRHCDDVFGEELIDVAMRYEMRRLLFELRAFDSAGCGCGWRWQKSGRRGARDEDAEINADPDA